MRATILAIGLAVALNASGVLAAQDRIVTWSEIVEKTLGPNYDVENDPLPDDVHKLKVLAEDLRNRLFDAENSKTVADAGTRKADKIAKARAAYFTPQNQNAVYELIFTPSGRILQFLSYFNDTFKSAKQCWHYIEGETIPKWRTATYRHKSAWLLNDHVLIEFVTDRFGRRFWQVTIQACGPRKESVLEKNIKNMGLNFDATLRAVVDSIHDHGFEP